ncbi:MAG: hypothetical protein LIO46_04195 [Clostridiales bacterium]|nr:hypothetical protein [Clostridiales bacterium]
MDNGQFKLTANAVLDESATEKELNRQLAALRLDPIPLEIALEEAQLEPFRRQLEQIRQEMETLDNTTFHSLAAQLQSLQSGDLPGAGMLDSLLDTGQMALDLGNVGAALSQAQGTLSGFVSGMRDLSGETAALQSAVTSAAGAFSALSASASGSDAGITMPASPKAA